MSEKKLWRSHLLVFSVIGISLTAVASLIFPSVGNRPVADFEFPQSFDTGYIFAYQFSKTRRKKESKANQQYQFELDNQKFTLGIDYAVGVQGNIASYLQNFTQLNQASINAKKIKYQPDIGHYALLKDNKNFYLSSCISPRSLSSVTQKQFSRQRYHNDLRPIIIWQWLHNQASIRDRRCLWVLLSTPINSSWIGGEYDILESVWGDLYRWWLPNFPSLTGE